MAYYENNPYLQDVIIFDHPVSNFDHPVPISWWLIAKILIILYLIFKRRNDFRVKHMVPRLQGSLVRTVPRSKVPRFKGSLVRMAPCSVRVKGSLVHRFEGSRAPGFPKMRQFRHSLVFEIRNPLWRLKHVVHDNRESPMLVKVFPRGIW